MRATLPKMFLRLFRGGRTDGRLEDGGPSVLARCCELLPCLRRMKEMRRKEEMCLQEAISTIYGKKRGAGVRLPRYSDFDARTFS